MHDHGQPHGGAPSRALAIVFGITAAVLVVEVVGALLTGSLALLVDAAHVLTDVLGLGLALVAARLASRSATARRTYGWARAEVLGATAQAAVLLGVGVFVVIEAIRRFAEPADVPGPALLRVRRDRPRRQPRRARRAPPRRRHGHEQRAPRCSRC